jgi:4-diphosphocytidyl-2-C-methyl-D-erythritol kinase
MIKFPNCKINLGLSIINRRVDGFHDLETIFFPVQLCDALEVIESKESNINEVEFTSSGLEIAGNNADNLCVKAYQILKADFTQLTGVKMHLHKLIPMGAGLGGGSADGAFALQIISDLFSLNLSSKQLIDYAAKLGSDCPFFIINKPCYGTGRGEILEPLALSLKGYSIALINPGIHVNTGWAFKQLTPIKPVQSVKEIVQLPIAEWKTKLVNDFEEPVTRAYPIIADIKRTLYNLNAAYAAMSGSGSTVFGIFKDAVFDKIDFSQIEHLSADIKLYKASLG